MRKNGAFYQNLKMCTFLLIFVYNNTSNVNIIYRLRVLLREEFSLGSGTQCQVDQNWEERLKNQVFIYLKESSLLL